MNLAKILTKSENFKLIALRCFISQSYTSYLIALLYLILDLNYRLC